jgi:hypothetical protein
MRGKTREDWDCDPNWADDRGKCPVIAERGGYQSNDPVLRFYQTRLQGVRYPFRAIAGSRKGKGVSSLIRGRAHRRDDRMKDHPFPQAGIERSYASLEHGPRK